MLYILIFVMIVVVFMTLLLFKKQKDAKQLVKQLQIADEKQKELEEANARKRARIKTLQKQFKKPVGYDEEG